MLPKYRGAGRPANVEAAFDEDAATVVVVVEVAKMAVEVTTVEVTVSVELAAAVETELGCF